MTIYTVDYDILSFIVYDAQCMIFMCRSSFWEHFGNVDWSWCCQTHLRTL